MTVERLDSRLSRRSAVAALAGSILAFSGGSSRVSGQDVPTPVATGDCSIEPGVQLLINWRLGLPVLTHEEMLPRLDWKLVSHPSLPLFLQIPPDWEMIAGWADSYTETGMPIFRDAPPQIAHLTLARIISPDATAAFDYVVGNVQGPPLTPPQVAVGAVQTTLGENPRLREICTYDDANPLAPSWFYAFHHLQSILISSGTALGLPDIYLPATTVTFQNLYGPQELFEPLMRGVFIPILTQLIGGGGGSDDTDDPDDPDDPDDGGEGDGDDGEDDGGAG